VIYDAAHCFGVKYQGRPITSYGNAATLSFHATKIFHTVEGGAIVTSEKAIADRISYMRNFGHNGPNKFFGLGINGKNSEFHAAMGLCILPKISSLIGKRKEISDYYDSLLLNNSEITKPKPRAGTEYNYSYYPVLFSNEEILLKIQERLNAHQIFPRRYFYPALSSLSYVDSGDLPIAEDISRRVICLPLYDSLLLEDVERVCTIIKEGLG
jgi:dTDP-4-amino-4,6-dideoxygalactose transaminase